MKIKISDGAVRQHLENIDCNVIRDIQNPLLQLRFNQARTAATWRVYSKGIWHKVGTWPERKTRDIRADFSLLLERIRHQQESAATKDYFITIGDLLRWYSERMAANTNLSAQRKSDIKSSVKCHLIPRLAHVKIIDIDKNLIDKCFVWPLQKNLAKGSVVKKFHMLKAAFKDACDLELLINHPMGNMKITDFGDFSQEPSEANLNPHMVKPLLADIEKEPALVKVICLIMLVLGTRIGETLLARWSNVHLANDDTAVWNIPKADTKTKSMTIHLPIDVVSLLRQWQRSQQIRRYTSRYLFPNVYTDVAISYETIRKTIRKLSKGKWHSHDLRKCARQCWEEQGVDGLVAERMLNHTLGKTTRAYTGNAYDLRRAALTQHCHWLKAQHKNCFILDPSLTPSKTEHQQQAINNAA